MDIIYTSKRIVFDKDLRAIDRFVFSFVQHLSKAGVKYVLISGYVALFFGRDRSTEDVDIFVEDLPFERFSEFWSIASNDFACLNTSDPKLAFELFSSGIALRFHRKGSVIPNIEFKPLKTPLDRYCLENRLEVECNGQRLYISQLELQIAFKLWLGSDKDKEDARFLYKLLKEHLNMPLLKDMLSKLSISNKKFQEVTGESLD